MLPGERLCFSIVILKVFMIVLVTIPVIITVLMIVIVLGP